VQLIQPCPPTYPRVPCAGTACASAASAAPADRGSCGTAGRRPRGCRWRCSRCRGPDAPPLERPASDGLARGCQSSRRSGSACPAIAPEADIYVPPPAVAKVTDIHPCGRPQPAQHLLARPNRITVEIKAETERLERPDLPAIGNALETDLVDEPFAVIAASATQ
jgi:hypothetical protein